MNVPTEDWERRVAQEWASIDAYPPEAFVARIEQLAAELASSNPVALFERACAFDSTGHSDRAVPLGVPTMRWRCCSRNASAGRMRWTMR